MTTHISSLRNARRSVDMVVKLPLSSQADPKDVFMLLENIRALMVEFKNKFQIVWNIYTPGDVSVQLSDAMSLLPQLHGLTMKPEIKLADLEQVAYILTQMRQNLPFAVNAVDVQSALTDHGQVADLLNRAEHELRDTIALLKSEDDEDNRFNVTATTQAMSAREILAAAVIVLKYLDSVLHTSQIMNNSYSIQQQ